jgi:hypothetical protein
MQSTAKGSKATTLLLTAMFMMQNDRKAISILKDAITEIQCQMPDGTTRS